MRISDWSSDVCSSDLQSLRVAVPGGDPRSAKVTDYRIRDVSPARVPYEFWQISSFPRSRKAWVRISTVDARIRIPVSSRLPPAAIRAKAARDSTFWTVKTQAMTQQWQPHRWRSHEARQLPTYAAETGRAHV